MATCNVCNKSNEDIKIIGRCAHNSCLDCLFKCLDTFTSARIKCPVPGCTKTIHDSLIRKCLSNDKLSLYDKLCLAPNTRKCLIKECPYFVACEDDEVQFTCEICHQPNCVKCKQLHEENVPCPSKTNYNYTKFENAASTYILSQRKQVLIKDSDNNELIPNSERFECPICFVLILPREGVCLRNCMDTICRDCLKGSFLQTDNLRNMSCPISECCRPLTERECIALVGKDKFQEFCLDIVKPIMSNCQTPECKGMWDSSGYSGMHKCELCKKMNCTACHDIHENKTCEEFRLTRRFIDAEKFRKNLEERNKINCKKCGNMIIKNLGCNALRCPNCRLQVCAYTGLEVGPDGCKCTNSKRCFDGCNPGCIPEGGTPYEKKLYDYFFNN